MSLEKSTKEWSMTITERATTALFFRNKYTPYNEIIF